MNKYINSSTKNNINEHFKQLITEIKENGLETAPRGQKVKEIYFKEMNIDPHYPIINFKSREFPYAYLVGELAWYLNRDNNIEYINNFSSFWKNIATEEGTINSNYGNLIFGEQLAWAKAALKKDKDTRQAIVFLNQPKFQYLGNKDFVCTMYLNFFIRENKLNMKMTIRSNDSFYGLSFDAPFFSFVLQHMYLWLKEEQYPDLELGSYFHFADNIHYYERHFDVAEKIMKEDTSGYPSFVLKKPMFYINEEGPMIYKITDESQKFIDDALELRKNKVIVFDYINLLRQFFEIENVVFWSKK